MLSGGFIMRIGLLRTLATALLVLGMANTAPFIESASAKDPDDDRLKLAPQDEWKLREYPDKCRISRVFGEGENRTTLWIDQGGKEPNYNVTLIGHPLRNSYGNAVRVQFGEEKDSLRSYIRAKSSKGRPVLTMYGVALAPPDIDRKKDAEVEELNAERLEAIDIFRISESIVDPLEFDLGPMAAPMLFLRGCSEQLYITLARAQSSQSGKAQPPKMLNRSRIAKLIRYPTYLVRAEMEGKIDFRLTIDNQGKPRNCNISASNRPQLFDDAVCLGLMKHAKFDPALDAKGQPTASYYFSGITFYIR